MRNLKNHIIFIIIKNLLRLTGGNYWLIDYNQYYIDTRTQFVRDKFYADPIFMLKDCAIITATKK